jgi:nucleobase:cation symporter-1, NCS1 family
VTVDEVDEAFANIYSTAVSLQNLAPAAPQRALIGGVAAVATAIALVIELSSYEAFLFLLGSFFVPLFGVLLADWLLAGGRYLPEEAFRAPPWRTGLVAAWLVGFALYQWLHPQGPDWWVEQVERLNPPDVAIGSTLPSFAVAFVLAAAASAVSRRVGAPVAER